MNLDQIATKCFILALFIRDDGQRLLLGDGYYDFNQKLQHFQGNTIANDVVEIQGDNGQLLAGQVMRSGAQKFEGYIGDATTNRQTIEQKRSDFMAFFRIKHFYQVVYIFPDGTAIQRQRGYLTDAPTIPEIFQKFPEYSVALNFEDASYYEYAEDEHGDEIYAHIIELALSGNATGGLVWDAIGAVSNGISWSGIQTAQGEYISITNELDIPAKLASVEMLGNAEQTTYSGKNLLPVSNPYANTGIKSYDIALPVGTYTLSFSSATTTGSVQASYFRVYDASNTDLATRTVQYADKKWTFTISSPSTKFAIYAQNTYAGSSGVTTTFTDIMLESGNQQTTYEPFVGSTPASITASPNPDYPQAVNTVTGEQTVKVVGKNLFSGDFSQFVNQGGTGSTYVYFKLPTTETYTLTLRAKNDITASGRYIGFSVNGGNANGGLKWVYANTTATAGQTLSYNSTYGGSNALFVSMYPKTANDLQWLVDNFDIQLELGNSASSFEPYQGQSYPIDLGSIELAKIGTYQDRIYKQDGKWYIEKQVGKVVLDGTEAGWSWADTARYTITTANIGAREAISDHFTYVNYTGHATTASPSFDISSNLASIGFHDKDTTSLNNFKTWLSTHNTTVYYALATPTTTEITNEALIAQLDALGASSLFVGVNNIGTETQNAVPTLKIEYYTEVDLDGAGYEWEPGGNTAKTIVTVAGVDSAWPIWTVQGGAQNPTLTNITTGQTITWQGFVPEGQTLTINMAEMTADLAGANVFEYITGEWIRLAPGNNKLVYTAGSADKPSTLSWNGVLA